ncbi:putative ribonuclease H protein [Vitis vinifera]|uniref:Putative ribonuclease H protein n=1 Tax=Vitis vinifera TaxID=29760 RepID=A0A438H8K9_VITVI|nr:putative ribonuclease H protein [Vitis vinifera]
MGALGGDFVETKVKTDLAEGRAGYSKGSGEGLSVSLSDLGGWRPSVNNLEFDSIGAEEAARLELMFTVEEVFLALSELNGDKALARMGMEALTSLINRAVRGGYLLGCRIRGREGAGIQVSHLLFADDTLVFCEDSQEQLAFLSWLLLWFEATSGLRINLNKSEILPSVMVWDGMEERMRKRLALWKRQFISKGGRITLIRSTLASMPTYLMSLMRMPRVVKLRLEKIQRDFLWGGGALEKKPHLIKWEEVGALEGVGRALGWGSGKKSARKGCCCSTMFLFRWGMVKGREGCGLLDSMGEVGGWNPRFLRPFNDWEVEEVERLLLIIQGKRLNADLEDRMVWNETKDGIFSVKSCFNSLDHSSAVPFPWRIIWSTFVPTKVGFFAWEASWGKVLTQNQLKRRGWNLANKCPLCCDEEETINHILIHCSKAKFGVKDAYGLLISHSTFLFPKKGIWVENVPSKLAFFAWEATWGRILTIDRLQKRGWQISNRCYLCGSDEENVSHLLIHCTVARVLWGMTLSLFGAQWVFPETVKEVITSWKGSFVGKKEEENMEIHTVVYFLDGVEGNE